MVTKTKPKHGWNQLGFFIEENWRIREPRRTELLRRNVPVAALTEIEARTVQLKATHDTAEPTPLEVLAALDRLGGKVRQLADELTACDALTLRAIRRECDVLDPSPPGRASAFEEDLWSLFQALETLKAREAVTAAAATKWEREHGFHDQLTAMIGDVLDKGGVPFSSESKGAAVQILDALLETLGESRADPRNHVRKELTRRAGK
jgi:hypothetical protein